MDQKVVGVVFCGVVAMVAVVTSPQLLDVVWCSAAVVLWDTYSHTQGASKIGYLSFFYHFVLSFLIKADFRNQCGSNRNLTEAARNPQMIKTRKKKIKTRGFLHFLYFCFMFQSGSRFIIFSIFFYHLFIVSLSFFHHFPTFVLFFGKFVDHFPARVSFSQPRIKPEPRGSSPEPANDEKNDKKWLKKLEVFCIFYIFAPCFNLGPDLSFFLSFVYYFFFVFYRFFIISQPLYYFVGKFVDHFPARVSFSQPGIKPEPRGSSPEPANDKKTVRNDKNPRFSAFSIFLLHVSIGVQIYHFFIICLSFFIVFYHFPTFALFFWKLWIISQHVYRFHSPEANRNLAEAARNPQMMKKR